MYISDLYIINPIYIYNIFIYIYYITQVFDLAAPDEERVPLNVREAADKGIFLEGLSEEEVSYVCK